MPDPQQRWRRFARGVYYLGPLFAWLGVLWALGARYGTFTASHVLFRDTLYYLRPSLPRIDETFIMGETLLLRKLAVLVCYGVLTLLLVRALQWGRPALRWQTIVAVLPLGIGVALLDAFHKNHEPDRHGTVSDILLDGIAIALFLGGTLLFFGLKALERRLLAPPVPTDMD